MPRSKTNEEFIAEGRAVVLEDQLDAFTRVLSLLPERVMTVEDVFNVLAQAETDAEFLCGFVGLNQCADEKRWIAEHAITRGLVTVGERGQLSLTSAGKERARTELPEPIEESILSRK